MLEPFGDDAQREGLDLGYGFTAVGAVAEDAGQLSYVCEPATVIFLLELNREGHKSRCTSGRAGLQARRAGGDLRP